MKNLIELHQHLKNKIYWCHRTIRILRTGSISENSSIENRKTYVGLVKGHIYRSRFEQLADPSAIEILILLLDLKNFVGW